MNYFFILEVRFKRLNMTIKLYYNQSDKFTLDKKLKKLKEFTSVHLKENTDIVNPTVILGKFDDDLVSELNYFYIPRFKRYYFLTGLRECVGNITEITGHTDTLSSVKTQLKNKQTYIIRNEYDNNPYYQDNELPLRSDKQYIKLNVGTVGSASHIYITVNNGKKIESGA